MTERKKTRPGVMIYFDAIRPSLKRLDNQQLGILLKSVVDYAEYGVIPELDPMTGMAFDMLVPKIDRDAEKYEESREQRTYAVYKREQEKRGEDFLSFEKWKLERKRSEAIGPITPDNENIGPYPSTSPPTHAFSSAKESKKGSLEADFEQKRQTALNMLNVDY